MEWNLIFIFFWALSSGILFILRDNYCKKYNIKNDLNEIFSRIFLCLFVGFAIGISLLVILIVLFFSIY